MVRHFCSLGILFSKVLLNTPINDKLKIDYLVEQTVCFAEII